MVAVDDGLLTGNFNFADICFLVAFILFAVAFLIRLTMKPMPIDHVVLVAGFAALAFGLLAI